MGDALQRDAALVHVGQRLDENDRTRCDVRLRGSVLGFPAIDSEAPRHFVDDPKADVVARALITGAGISQTGDDARLGYAWGSVLSPTVGVSAGETAGSAASTASCSTRDGSIEITTVAGSMPRVIPEGSFNSPAVT